MAWKRSFLRFCSSVFCASALLLLAPVKALTQLEIDPRQPVWMPRARARDSKQVYSFLLLHPVIQFSFQGPAIPPPSRWLVMDLTPSNRDGQPCKPEGQLSDEMNPHFAIHPPARYEQDFAEMLEDFDQHCHDLIELAPSDFGRRVRVQILDENQQQLYYRALGRDMTMPPFKSFWPPHDIPERKPAASEYAGASGLVSLSEVFFNRRRTVAMVAIRNGSATWTVLGRTNGVWRRLPWRSLLLVIN